MNILATFSAGATDITVNGLHQWDYGRKLEVHDDTLPALVEIHFACAGMEEAVVRSCEVVNGVATATIPDRCLEQTSPVYAWVYVIEGTSGVTVKTVTMPVITRTKPQAGASVPDELSDRYTEALTAMNALLEQLRDGTITPTHASTADTALRALDADEAGVASNLAALYLHQYDIEIPMYSRVNNTQAGTLYLRVEFTDPKETSQFMAVRQGLLFDAGISLCPCGYFELDGEIHPLSQYRYERVMDQDDDTHEVTLSWFTAGMTYYFYADDIAVGTHIISVR